jgi:hypothetical protein
VIALRLAARALYAAVELGCDVDGARDTGAAPAIAYLETRQRMRKAAGSAQPAPKRAAVTVLSLLASPVHPPVWMRRAVLRALAR